MRKKWSKALSLALAMSMGVSGIPTTTLAENNAMKMQTVKEGTSKVNKWKNATKPTKNVNKQAYAEGEAIVMYKSSGSAQKGNAKALKLGKDMVIESTCDFTSIPDGIMRASNINENGVQVSLVTSTKYTTQQLIQKLQQQENVLYVEPNYICKAQATGDYSEYLWAWDNKGQNAGTEGIDLNIEKAGTPVSDKEKVVAIIDTGVNYEHEDLASVIWNNPYTTELKGAHGYDFSNSDADPMDDNGHGSHCAGIIAGDATNSIGVKGIAGNNVKIMALKFLDSSGGGYLYDAISAYNYIYRAQKLGVNVVAVNNSWGGYSEYGDDILEEVMNMVGSQGALSICAASNDSEDNDEVDMSPTNFDSPYIISVAASNENAELATFSNYGKTTVDLAAPGTNILSSVAEDTFNPSIYENVDELCGYYKDFTEEFVGTEITMDDAMDSGKIMVEDEISADKFHYTIVKDGDAKVSVQQDKTSYFGLKKENAASLKWEVKEAKAGESYMFIVPYMSEATKEGFYQSFMLREDAPELGDDFSLSYMEVMDMKVASGGVIRTDAYADSYIGSIGVYGKENYWSHISYKLQDKINKTGMHALVFSLYIEKDGDYALYFDDFGMSKANVPSKEFGKYDFYNGTSMATPYVTGAVALAKGLYPEESPLETRARIVGSTTKKEALKDKVITEGVLDLEKINKPNMVLSGAGIQADGVVTIDLVNAKDDVKVTVNGEEKTVIQKNSKGVSFQGMFDKNMDVVISSGEDTVKTTLFFLSGEEIKKNAVVENSYETGNMVSNGDKLQFVSDLGNIITYDVDNEVSYMNPSVGMYGEKASLPVLTPTFSFAGFDAKTLFGDEAEFLGSYDLHKSSNAISHGKQLFVAIRLELGYAEENVLAMYDEKDMKWEKVTDIPKAFNDAEQMMIASYNGKIYVMGGYQCDANKAIADVYSYDKKADTWTKEASMPEARFAGKAVVTNGKLVVTLGGNENGGCATNYVFDGTNWTKGGTLSKVMDKKDFAYLIPYEEGMENSDTLIVISLFEIAIRLVPYYDGVVGNTDQGLIYAGMRAEGLGNTFTYDMNTHTFGRSNLKLTTYDKDDMVMGGVVGNKLYLLSGAEYSDYYEDDMDDWKLSQGAKYAGKNLQEEMDEDYGFGSMASELLFISSVDVTNSTVEVSQESIYEQGYIQGVGKYNIGETATFYAVPFADFFVKDLFVNGEKVENGYSAIVTQEMDDMVVSASFGEYVSSIYLPYDMEVFAGETTPLLAEIYPVTAENQKLIWSSSDESIATVDANGKVTAKKAGGIVRIKAVAADRGTVSAVCTIKVVEKVVPTKIKLVASKKTLKAGQSVKIKARITPKNATNQEVKWTTSNKKYATVNSQGNVTAKKAGKGKTVTITATCVGNKKVKASIKIKIKK